MKDLPPCAQCGKPIKVYYHAHRNPDANAIRSKRNHGNWVRKDHDLCQTCFHRLTAPYGFKELVTPPPLEIPYEYFNVVP